MKHDETRSLAPGARGRRFHQGRLFDAAIVEPTVEAQRAKGAAPLVLDEPAQDDVGARCHVALQPVAAPRTWDVEAVTAFRDDALETVFGDDVEERLAVLCQMLWHRDHTAADP